MILLAQITNAAAPMTLPDPHSPAALGWVVIVIAGIFTVLNQGTDLWRKWTKPAGSEQRDVRINSGCPTKAEYDKHVEENKREHENLFSKIGGVERGARQSVDDKVKAIADLQREEVRQLHQKIDVVAREVSAVTATNTVQNQNIASFSAKLDRVVENIVVKLQTAGRTGI